MDKTIFMFGFGTAGGNWCTKAMTSMRFGWVNSTGDHYGQIETYLCYRSESQNTAADHTVQGHVTVVR